MSISMRDHKWLINFGADTPSCNIKVSAGNKYIYFLSLYSQIKYMLTISVVINMQNI